jgi:hypothetical protein
MTRGGRGLRALLAALVCAVAVGVGPAARADVTAQGCNSRAVVVVEPGPGAVSVCFDGSISGLAALKLAGANPVTYGFAGQGAAVCQLYGVGNPADQSCLIGPGGQYWAYFRAGPGAGGWTYSRAGAGSTTVTDGSVEGWRYGTGAAPGFVAFCSVVSCAPPPTSPPATAPPVTAAPVAPAGPAGPAGRSASPASPAGGGNGGAAASGAPATTAPTPAKDGKSGADAGSGAPAATSTTAGSDGKGTTGKQRARGAADDVALGPGNGSGDDSGSPVGVVIAIVVVVLAAGTGFWVRHRRRRSAPG